MKKYFSFALCLVSVLFAQYSVEWSQPAGALTMIDVDSDGLYELPVNANPIVFYNGDYSVCWSIPRNSLFSQYCNIAIPRDLNGDGLIVPTNTDNDAALELIIYGYTMNPSYQGKIQVYDCATHLLEWESAVINSAFTASLEDLDGDNKDEIIVYRYGTTTSTDVYAYTGQSIQESEYNQNYSVKTLPNPIPASLLSQEHLPLFDLLGRIQTGKINQGIYFTEHEGRKIKIVVE
ncbi:MAG: hypothetical protein L0Y76_04840 [Ignavibacteria bacterium]|nr:hypothetical protein [Ignavibacteria bacterium]